MKLTNTRISKNKSGMTLLELTVVILVLLSLISILFVGARAWKKGSDRAGCILNIRNVQQAVRGYMNTHPDQTTGPVNTLIYSDDGSTYMKTPKCPSNTAVAYGYDVSVLTPGTIFLECATADAADHIPTNAADW
jgi:prepilin-type N-terminal cleavage/methylation domain-containing protein